MIVAALLISAFALATAHVYERCELARDLLKLGINKDDVATWVCIAFHESRFDTAARNPHSGDHGLLQISELYWCGPGKACGVPCSAFRDEDIYDDVQCALRIHEEHTRLQGNGFLAWVVYPHHCKHNAKKYIVDCDSTKTISKYNDAARFIKTFEKNTTAPPLVTYSYTDNKKPGFLVINDLYKESNINEFERSYYNNDKKPFNWLNFKIDNIDELKLPAVGKIQFGQFTTPRPVTTTIDPSLIGIKPPSPRKIESNQFRRRMMTFDGSKRFDYNFDAPAKSTKALSSDIDFLSQNIFLTRARALSTFNLDYLENASRKSTTTVAPKTTKYMSAKTTYVPNIDSNFLSQNIFLNRARALSQLNLDYIENTTKKPTTAVSPKATKHAPAKSTNLPSNDSDISQNIFLNRARALSQLNLDYIENIKPKTTTTVAPKTTTTVAPKTTTTVAPKTTKQYISTTQKSMIERFTVAPNNRRGQTRFTSQFTNLDHKTKIGGATINGSIIRNISMDQSEVKVNTSKVTTTSSLRSLFKFQTITPKPLITSISVSTTEKYEISDKSQATSQTNLPKTSSRFAGNSQTTPKSTTRSTWPTVTNSSSYSFKTLSTTEKPISSTSKISTLEQKGTSTPPKPTSSTEKVSQTSSTTPAAVSTVKTTQSIFDLYLNPTRATITPFKFSSFNNNPFKLRIFSGGTTTPSSVFKNQ
ncbi:unnamed protein product, partial [Brenthis ino]